MYTMKDFREKRIAVRFGQKHVKEFLRMCEEEGVQWSDSCKATEFVPVEHGSSLIIALQQIRGEDVLRYGGYEAYAGNMTIVDFEDFEHQPAPAYKITIECDGTTTTARMEVNGREVKARQAKRNPADKFNWRVGAETAFARLWGEKKVKTKPNQGVREVKRPAEVGEYVKIVNKFGHIFENYENGDIRRVRRTLHSVKSFYGWVYLEGWKGGTAPQEYVVLEGYKP